MECLWINISLGPGFAHLSSLWEFKKQSCHRSFHRVARKPKKKHEHGPVLPESVISELAAAWEDFGSIVKTHAQQWPHGFAEPRRVEPRLSTFVYGIDQEVLAGKWEVTGWQTKSKARRCFWRNSIRQPLGALPREQLAVENYLKICEVAAEHRDQLGSRPRAVSE